MLWQYYRKTNCFTSFRCRSHCYLLGWPFCTLTRLSLHPVRHYHQLEGLEIWACGSVVEHLRTLYEALGSIPGTAGKERKKEKKEKKETDRETDKNAF